MFAAGKTATVSGAAPDDKFNYVTMLLHGDGTNGAQNNTFLDSSSNAFSITRNGNTTQGSFSPYGSNWSNYFGGSGNYLSVANNTALQMSTGDFTIEFWLNFSSLSNYQTIFEKGYVNAGGLLIQTNTGTGTLIVYASGSAVITASSASTVGAWNHYALVRNSGTLTLYKNGVSVGSVSNSTNFNNSADPFFVGGSTNGGGYYFVGNMSNFRVVKGTAVYTGSFTPSTTPLTAVSGTSLLTCQSNRFIDNSSNAFSLTVGGTPSVQRFNPFGTSTAYSTSVIGGSGYFDNSGDYLSAPASANLALGTGNFTLEAWVYATGAFATDPIFESRSAGGSTAGYAFLVNSSGKLDIYNNGFVGQSSIGLNINCWNHVAVVRSGTGTNQTAYYVNGAAAGTVTFAANLTDGSSNETKIGGSTTAGENWGGYICDGRITKSAVYSGAFTPNTSPLTTSSSPALLLNFTNGAIYDNAMMNDLETVGNAQISTSVKKYGTGSMYFDGTGDYLTIANSPNLQFSTGAFTFECWIYLNSTAGTKFIADFGNNSLNGWSLYDDGSLQVRIANVDQIATTGLSTSTWYHLAVVRSGTTMTLYVDGVSKGSYASASTDFSYSGSKYVGNTVNGYIDDLRITKGYARYTANFTPPTAAFSNTGPN